jgi:secondary thiamine-phosphate synthase enzyme
MQKVFEYRVQTTRRSELVNITNSVQKSIAESGVKEGICVVFVPHTTAAVTINENADPDVTRDINQHMEKMVPEHAGFAHSEGNSDAHIKTSLVGPSITVIVSQGRALLGVWQGIYFAEFDGPRSRTYLVKVLEG